MTRRVIIFAIAGPALLIALAGAALWVRSFWVMDSIYLERLGHGWQATSVRGRLIIVRVPAQWNTRDVHRGAYRVQGRSLGSTSERLADDRDTRTLGPFYWGSRGPLPRGATTRSGPWRSFRPDPLVGWSWVGLPHAAPVVLFAMIAMIGLIPVLRRRRRRAGGLCQRCGYDLRASGERCPECGERISTG